MESTPQASDRLGAVRRIVESTFSLQCKGIVLVVLLILTVTATVAGYLLDAGAKLARRHQDEDVVQLAAMLAKAGSASIIQSDSKSLQALVDKSANGAPLRYVLFLDVEGAELAAAEHSSVKVLERVRREGLQRPSLLGVPLFAEASDETAATLDITYPINPPRADPNGRGRPTELIGYVRVGVLANAWYRSMAGRLDLLVGVGIIVAVVAVPLGFLLIRRILSPLESLTISMLRFSQGELDIRSPVRRRDEIGRLATAFNRMADKHQRAHERVLRLNSKLEERVVQRTKQLRDLAVKEPLTGLYNRRHFNEVLQRSLAEAVRYDSELSLIMIDLDNFKQVNDRLGHHRGDEVLVAAAATINSQLRTADVAARFGGDEFVLLLPQTHSDRAVVLAERISERFQTDLAQKMPGVCAGMSLGIASLSDIHRRDGESLIRAADRALYKVKTAGKGGIATAAEQAKPALT